MTSRIPLGFGNLQAEIGDHIGHFFETADQWQSVVVPYFTVGLQRNEICVYVTSPQDHAESTITNALAGEGIDVDRCLESGQLILGEGKPTPQLMEAWLDEVAAQVPESYDLVRWGGDMTWSLKQMPSSEVLMTWECTCNIKDVPAIYLCQYDLTRFLGNVTVDALKTHPLCIIGDTIHKNPFYIQPQVMLQQMRAPASSS